MYTSTSEQLTTNFQEEVDEIIISTMNQEVIGGLAVGIIQDNKLIYSRNFGFADMEEQKPITSNTIFRVGSISKTFTAIAIMQLWEQGKFQLDDPVNDYLQAYKIKHKDPSAPPVTFRHLLTHTAGIGELRNFFDLLLPVIALGRKPNQTTFYLQDYYQKGITPEIYPGRKWAYANHGFATLGQLVEDISGETLSQYAIRHIFEPLGMTQTDYLLSERARDELARGYFFHKNKFKKLDYLEIVVAGAGSVFSSVNDMSKYVSALLGRGKNQFGQILQAETLQLMTQPHYRLEPHLNKMGLGFFLGDFDGHQIVYHDGGWPGFVSSMMVAPNVNLGVVVFTNTSASTPHKIAQDLLQHFLKIPQATFQLPRPHIPPSPHLWSKLCGYYTPEKGLNTNFRIWLLFGGGIEIFVKDNSLQMRSLIGLLQKPVKLYPIDASEPLAFAAQANHKWKSSLVFKRKTYDNSITHLNMSDYFGFCTLYKRSHVFHPIFLLKTIITILLLIILTIIINYKL